MSITENHITILSTKHIFFKRNALCYSTDIFSDKCNDKRVNEFIFDGTRPYHKDNILDKEFLV